VLAFNLGVFFRNLSGAEVDFSAKSAQCEFQFVGSVQEFRQEQDTASHLSVALRGGDLVCHISIEEEEAVEAPEEAKVDVRLAQRVGEAEREVLHATFRFEDISLKPHVPEPAPEPPAAAPPPKAS
jgi:hypothetical protein